ncbi:ATP:cob(I)alamin adenosyltransferase, partial [Geobacillus stearothermophilus]|nr:ATP:cob(I)alamin adenosyltransferase [Geobacillus stearothermophilus]
MKLYTRTGDKGKTSLIGGRVDKDHLRVEAYGTIDEANSFIGWALALLAGDERFDDLCAELQKIGSSPK